MKKPHRLPPSRLLVRLLAFLAILWCPLSVLAQSGTGLKGEYFTNTTLNGSPTLTRTDATVNFNWGVGSPHASIPVDSFSVRWTGQVQPQYSETYTFYVNTDDGVRMWVNGAPLVNDWTGHPAQEFNGAITLVGGQKYDITVEYFETGGDALAELRWSSPSTTKAIIPQTRLYPASAPNGTGLKGDYFNNTTVTGTPVLTRTDATVNFQWNGTSPGSPVAASNFSARWCGRVQPERTESYTFYTNSDDGVRLWVNGVQLINNWTDHAPTENSGTIELAAGQSYSIAMEYYQGGGGSLAELRWSSASTPKAIIPQVRLYPAGVPTGTGLKGEYFANDSLSGSPVLTRTDATVDFVWPGAPTSGIPSDHFSVYWSGQVQPQYSGTYTFYTNADDGVRLWVNGVQLINDWNAHPPIENSGSINLVGGQKYNIELEFFENEAGAEVKLSWANASQPKQIIPQVRLYPTMAASTGNGLKGEYYNSQNLTGSPVLTRTDSVVDFNWGTSSPGGSVLADGFSVSWTGQIEPNSTDTYTFYALADDGVRLWVNGVPQIDDWGNERSGQERTGMTPLQLNAGQRYDIVMEMYDNGGGAAARLSWSAPSVAKQVIPSTRLFSASNGGGGPAIPVPVGNFSFETPSLGAGNFEYNTTGGSWTFYAAGIAANGSGFTGSNPGAPNGTQVAFLQGIGGNMSQSVSNFLANVPYTITFSAAQRNYSQSAQAWIVTLDGNTIGTFSPPQSATTYSDYTAQFSVSSPGTYVLAFQNLNSGDSTVFIDNIRITPTNGSPTVPVTPSALSTVAVSGTQINLAWTDNSDNETGFKIERKIGAGGTYAPLITVGANATSYQDAGLTASTTYYYRVRATNGTGDSALTNESNATTQASGDPLLSGTIIGTSGSYGNDPNVTKEKAMDGSLATFFDAYTGDGNWVGLDLGPTAYKVITKVRFAPRTGWAARMVGGKFQGSSSATFASGVVDLFTIGASPAEGVYTQQTISNSTGFRYVRFLSPNGGFGNVAEIEFYGHDGSLTPPTAPSSLSASAASSTQINLSWTDNSNNETSFKIERKTGAGGTYAQIGTTGSDVNSFSDGGITPSTQYFYRVRANNVGGDSSYSNESNATTQAAPPTTPAAPSNLVASAVSNTQINLTWTDNATNETGFKIERKVSGGSYSQIATVGANVTSYSSTGLTLGTTYFYQVRANNAAGDSGYSNESSATTTGGGDPNMPLLTNVGYDKVALTDNFWAPRINTNRTNSLPPLWQSFVYNHNLDNFAKTAGLMGGNQDGFPWADSDVYKTIEGMIYANKLQPDSFLADRINAIIPNIAAAQRADGYLDTYIQLGLQGRGGGNGIQPWQDMIALHEDYCMGHMIEAAVAHYQATGSTNFITVARNASNHMYNYFGPSPKVSGVPGHQEVELALMRLKDSAQGQQSDLDIAKFFIDERGRHSGGRTIMGEYCQDLRQVRVETEPLGHGVRGPYMWAGAVDVARSTNDTGLLNTMETVWQNVVDKKMYVTGGYDHQMYNEGFGPDYDLPNDGAYNETCAACAMMMFSHRLGNIRGDAKYADVIERVMYNTFAAGRNLNGSRLYYNGFMSRNSTKQRQGIACCATNIVRTIPSLQGYQYSTKTGVGIWVNQFMAGNAALSYGSATVNIQQVSNYPWDGAITINVNPSAATAFTLYVRVPAWVSNATATINGSSVNMATVDKGFLPITRTWQNGDVVQLNYPMPVRRIYAHSKVWANTGRVAIARGPMIYCLESPYNSTNVHRIVIPNNATFAAQPYNSGDLGGSVRITGTGINADNGAGTGFTLIPYAVWDNANNDNNSNMCVWIPESIATANNNAPDQGRLANAVVTYSYKNANDSAESIRDGRIGNNSNDQSIQRFTWWSHKGTSEWIAMEFPQMVVSRSDIMWFADASAGGDCDFPQSFNLEYWNTSTNAWAPVQLTANYNQAVDLFAEWHPSILRFQPVTTTKIRCNVQLRPNKSGGILEWRLPEN